ncbi:hypothetical protein [Nocardia sp. NPDC003979]
MTVSVEARIAFDLLVKAKEEGRYLLLRPDRTSGLVALDRNGSGGSSSLCAFLQSTMAAHVIYTDGSKISYISWYPDDATAENRQAVYRSQDAVLEQLPGITGYNSARSHEEISVQLDPFWRQ